MSAVLRIVNIVDIISSVNRFLDGESLLFFFLTNHAMMKLGNKLFHRDSKSRVHLSLIPLIVIREQSNLQSDLTALSVWYGWTARVRVKDDAVRQGEFNISCVQLVPVFTTLVATLQIVPNHWGFNIDVSWRWTQNVGRIRVVLTVRRCEDLTSALEQTVRELTTDILHLAQCQASWSRFTSDGKIIYC